MGSDGGILDGRGLRCPLPVLKAEKRLDVLKPGETLTVLATDPMAKIDLPLYCRQRGYPCVISTDGDVLSFAITKT